MALRVWLPLNGNLNNQGLSNLIFINESVSNLVVDNNGKIGKCYSRPTKQTTGRIISDKTINLDNNFTMCCWANVSDGIASANGLVSNHDHSSNTGVGINVKYISSTDFRISCSTGTGTGRTYESYYGTTNIKDTWHHLALTYDKTAKQLLLYVDGVVEYTLNNYLNASKEDYVMLFEWSTNYNNTNYRPAAKLNDVRIYDECLSQKQIKEISKGLVAHYKLDNFNGTNLITSLQAGGHTTIHGDTVQTDGTDADTYFWLRTSTLTQGQNYTFKAVVSGMPDNIIYRWAINNDENVRKFDLKNGLNVISFTCPSLNDFTKLLIDDRSRPSGWNYPITFSKIELIDSNGGSVIDVSGNGYNGKTSGTLIYNLDSARYSGSTNFNATGYIAVGRPMPRDELTVNVWAYMDNWASYNSRLGSCTEGGGWNFEPASSAMNFAVGVGTSSCTYMNNFTSSQAPLSGISAGWHMFTGTFDGIYKRLYIDGELKGEINGLQNGTTLTTKTPIFYNGNNGVFIGAEAGGTQTTGQAPYFNGSMVDFRIYATALSANDILTMYKNSGIIDNKGNVYAYEFREE